MFLHSTLKYYVKCVQYRISIALIFDCNCCSCERSDSGSKKPKRTKRGATEKYSSIISNRCPTESIYRTICIVVIGTDYVVVKLPICRIILNPQCNRPLKSIDISIHITVTAVFATIYGSYVCPIYSVWSDISRRCSRLRQSHTTCGAEHSHQKFCPALKPSQVVPQSVERNENTSNLFAVVERVGAVPEGHLI